MYQFYYSDKNKIKGSAVYELSVGSVFNVTAVRQTRWEEHCLECSAPACFGTCPHYSARSDGRCMRFANGIYTYPNAKGVGGEGARVRFRPWADMMTIIYPSFLPPQACADRNRSHRAAGKALGFAAAAPVPVPVKWQMIRAAEYAHRFTLKKGKSSGAPDAFVFHGYSFEKDNFRLIVEIFDSHTPVSRVSLELSPGENLRVIGASAFGGAAAQEGFLVKVYPENNIEAELDILWCDFVKGTPVCEEKPAEKVKCVVWDLDNTLWDGILAETDDPGTLQPRAGVRETVKALDERGVLQSVASKNDFAPAWERLETLGMADYFLYPQIHWNAKSGSLREIAASLNIGIDTFALIDDSFFERGEVRNALPQVRVYEEDILPELLTLPEFDVPVTAESRGRRLMYKAEEKRSVMKSSGTDALDFLRKCRLRITLFTPRTEEEKLRCFELVVRTNQLNMSGKKYTREEFDEVLAREDHTTFAFSCEDDFGSYGIVGFGQYRTDGRALTFTEFAMSCRVAGKYVESALFGALLGKENGENGSFTVNKTKKNTLLRHTLEEIGFTAAKEDENSVSYRFSAALKNSDIVTAAIREDNR